MSGKKLTESYYVNRINVVINYIEQNLDNDLSLKVVSEVACISPYHFHRIFSLVCKETIHQFVNRKRIEKITSLIINRKEISLKEVSLKYGFDNATSFSRAFKAYYGMSASAFKKNSEGSFNRIKKQKSKICKETITLEKYICDVEEIRQWSKQHARIEMSLLTEQKIAYIRHKGSFDKVINSFIELRQRAEPLGLLEKDVKWLMLIHDNPAITEERLITQSACIKIDDGVSLSSDISKMSIPRGKYLKGEFEIYEKDFKRAWDAMSVWMIDNNCVAGDGYYFELFHTNSLFTPNEKHRVDIFIPL
ncbi:helix-turn-helix domain-containing protein [Leptobacterium flavescens]|uniref:Helix-turn-helix domain-containing protein n=1 Tax=Leptobacterium flavescens TaxID=472055 RepID=A0A6P0UW24_9FLAO|nr:AraC family transcriptional regulator [Leptobacterium flavescens]NER14626.1 helix-turn-helix domain-containing protein [Leptobacterium flavescens]